MIEIGVAGVDNSYVPALIVPYRYDLAHTRATPLQKKSEKRTGYKNVLARNTTISSSPPSAYFPRDFHPLCKNSAE